MHVHLKSLLFLYAVYNMCVIHKCHLLFDSGFHVKHFEIKKSIILNEPIFRKVN